MHGDTTSRHLDTMTTRPSPESRAGINNNEEEKDKKNIRYTQLSDYAFLLLKVRQYNFSFFLFSSKKLNGFVSSVALLLTGGVRTMPVLQNLVK
jgi:hypothetical protein